jgi:hypothetical protein
VAVGGRVEDRDEGDDVRIVDGDEFVGLLILSQMLEFVDYYIHSAASRLSVEFVVKPRR